MLKAPYPSAQALGQRGTEQGCKPVWEESPTPACLTRTPWTCLNRLVLLSLCQLLLSYSVGVWGHFVSVEHRHPTPGRNWDLEWFFHELMPGSWCCSDPYGSTAFPSWRFSRGTLPLTYLRTSDTAMLLAVPPQPLCVTIAGLFYLHFVGTL